MDAALWRMLSVQLFFAGLSVLVALQLGGALRDRLGLLRGGLAPESLALGVLGTLALSGALQFAVDALGLTPGSTLEQLGAIASQAARTSPLLVLLAFGIAPAVCEELLCRGVLQRSLARAIGVWCVPAAALVFAVLHMDRVHSPAAFLLGGYLGALAWIARTTWLPIACHLANNAAAVGQELFPRAGAFLPRPRDWAEAALWLVVAGASLAIAARRGRSARMGRGRSSA